MAGRADRTDRDCQAFRGVLGTKVVVLKPGEPEHKGIIERAHDYLERSFLPGRTFSGPGDFNTSCRVAARSTPGPAGCWGAPRRIGSARTAGDAGAAAGSAGDRVARFARLARDHYIRLDSNDYSVHPGLIGRRVEIIADLDRVQVFCDGRLVADHERVWAWHQTMSDPSTSPRPS